MGLGCETPTSFMPAAAATRRVHGTTITQRLPWQQLLLGHENH